ncbi:hypothetical protein [Ktedonospora formicarum]|uniref:Uncharacterized protein n=1 Tax=Ktedonospora formicarum TaxID=2778364 RepID=A0A8J3HTU7_9CHLR|nr:hypothetical protein [Ktedonospora formicarum]GHO41866.1 hypothetical protein KSX_00290 [Ktedonospora formicarum]
MPPSEQQPVANVDRPVRSINSRVQIVLLAIGGTVIYGVLQDQMTAHICVEYFTIGHYDYWGLQDPTLLAFEWGVIATWWVGLFLGMALMISAQVGRSRPPLTARNLLWPVLVLLAITGIIAFVAGVTGYALAQNGAVYLVGLLATLVPEAKHNTFLADLWAHNAAYFVGIIGGIIVCIRSWQKRGRLRGIQSRKSRRNGESSASPLWERIVLFALVILGGVSLACGILFLLAVNV